MQAKIKGIKKQWKNFGKKFLWIVYPHFLSVVSNTSRNKEFISFTLNNGPKMLE